MASSSYTPPGATVQSETPEQAEARKKREAESAGRQGLNVQTSQTPAGANFEITGRNNEQYNAGTAALGGSIPQRDMKLRIGSSFGTRRLSVWISDDPVSHRRRPQPTTNEIVAFGNVLQPRSIYKWNPVRATRFLGTRTPVR